VTRLTTAYQATGQVKATKYQRHRFAVRYTKADIELLAYVDKAHGNLSGPATRQTAANLSRSLRKSSEPGLTTWPALNEKGTPTC
jgi:hypothetical protein